MFFDKETIYSKRFPPIREDAVDRSFLSPAEKETSYQNFCRRMSGQTRYEPIPGQAEKAQEFIALAKEFSEEYEIDTDIRRSPYSVEVSLHFYCMAWSKDMTRRFARLFNMCDNLSSFILKPEPSDFTLILELDTHKFYLSDMLINDF